MKNYIPIRNVLIYTMLLNMVAMGAKLVVGYLTGSLSLIADGFDSLFDSASNVIGLVGIYIAARPPDESHPYGHRKFETMAAVFIAVLLLGTCVEIVRGAINRLQLPTTPEINVWSFVALAISIVVHIYVTIYEYRQGKALKSEVLVADALHTRADIFVSISVAAGLVVIWLGYPVMDVLMALGIAVLIAKIGLDIIRDSTKILADQVALDAKRVEAIALGVKGVTSSHHIRSRGQEDDVHLDLHVRVEPDTPTAQAHAIAHEVQQRLLAELEGVRDVIVHVEPQPAKVTEEPDILSHIRHIATQRGLTIHALHASEIGGQFYISLHLEVGESMTLGQAHQIANDLEEEIHARIPTVAEALVHIEPRSLEHTNDSELLSSDAELVRQITAEAQGLAGVGYCHNVVVRHSGDQFYVSMHCTVNSEMPIEEAHRVSSAIEQQIKEKWKEVRGVSVHVEPA